MPRSVVFRALEFGRGEIIAGDPLMATPVAEEEDTAGKLLEQKIEIEERLKERGQLPLVVVSFEDLDEQEIDAINTYFETDPEAGA